MQSTLKLVPCNPSTLALSAVFSPFSSFFPFKKKAKLQDDMQHNGAAWTVNFNSATWNRIFVADTMYNVCHKKLFYEAAKIIILVKHKTDDSWDHSTIWTQQIKKSIIHLRPKLITFGIIHLWQNYMVLSLIISLE